MFGAHTAAIEKAVVMDYPYHYGLRLTDTPRYMYIFNTLPYYQLVLVNQSVWRQHNIKAMHFPFTCITSSFYCTCVDVTIRGFNSWNCCYLLNCCWVDVRSSESWVKLDSEDSIGSQNSAATDTESRTGLKWMSGSKNEARTCFSACRKCKSRASANYP